MRPNPKDSIQFRALVEARLASRLAQDCFLDLIGSAIEWTSDTDLNRHDQPETRYTLVCRDFELRQLVEALGIPIRDDESASDAIERALKE